MTTTTGEQPEREPNPDDLAALYRTAYEGVMGRVHAALTDVAQVVVERLMETAPATDPTPEPPEDRRVPESDVGHWNALRRAVAAGPETYSSEGWRIMCQRSIYLFEEAEAQLQRQADAVGESVAEEHAEAERTAAVITDLHERLDATRERASAMEARAVEIRQRYDLFVSGPISKVLEAVWDDAATATAEWAANNPGPGGPHDPPTNPFRPDSASSPYRGD